MLSTHSYRLMSRRSYAGSRLGFGSEPTSDLQFSSVSLLLHGDGANNATNATILDSSSNAHSLTRAGTLAQGSFSPFPPAANVAYSPALHSGSLYLNGSTDFVSLSAAHTGFAFGTGDFTVECWVRPTASTQAAFISNNYNWSTGQGNWGFYTTVGAANIIYFNSTSGNRASTTTATIALNVWTHVAYTRTGTTGRFFVNGVQLGTDITDNTNYASTTGTMYIGDKLGAGGKLTGYISNVRVVKGTALYTAGFSVPTQPLTAITNTQLLLSGTNSALVDSAAKSNLFLMADTKISTTVAKFGGSSIYFDGVGDYITALHNDVFSFGSSNFTVEMWVYTSSFADNRGLFSKRITNAPTESLTAYIEITTGKIAFTATGSGSSWEVNLLTTASISANTWAHLAFVRSGNTWTIYIDGVSQATTTQSISITSNTNAFTIGATAANGAFPFNGYIEDMRVTKGVARYTANFTPPNAAFPDK